MADMRNKLRKLQQAEGERLRRLRMAKAASPPARPIRCEGCGLEGADQWKPDGTFVRLFSVSGDHWDTGHVYCERCLERFTGETPNDLT